MDNELPASFFIQMGEMVNATKANTDAISKLAEITSEMVAEHREISGEFRDFKAGLADVQTEVRRLSVAIAIDEESRKDFQYLRRLREESNERKPIVRHVVVAVASAALIGLLGWTWGAMTNKAATEIRGAK